MKIRIGSRGSALALAQTNTVAGALRKRGHEVRVVVIQTSGDRAKNARFADIGAPGVFVREIEAALLAADIDLAVHSYKDLPSQSPEGLIVAAIPERLDPADRLVMRREFVSTDAARGGDGHGAAGGDATPVAMLPLVEGAIVGTASERRRALLRSLRPDLQLESIRGNVPTRLDKLRRGPYHAIVLAAAGLLRLERDAGAPSLRLEELASVRLDPAIFVPSPAQGAIALQCRADDPVVDALEWLHDEGAALPVRAERELLRLVDGGCSLPFGAWGQMTESGRIKLVAALEARGRIIHVRAEGGSPEEAAGGAWRALQALAGESQGGTPGFDDSVTRKPQADEAAGDRPRREA